MPDGWTLSTIGETCEVVNGGTPKTSVASYWGGPHQWITPAEMGRRNSPYIEVTARSVTSAGLQNSSARLLPPDSVILSSRAPIGHLAINTVPMATNQGCKGLVPGPRVACKFLYHYLSSIVETLDGLGTGATFRELSGSKLKEVGLPLPPLPEQRRIVAILDEAFEAIAKAKANTERNLDNAREVFESHLTMVFSTRRAGWSDRVLHSLCQRITVGHVGSMAARYKPSGIPFLRSQNVRPFSISMDNMVFIDDAFHASLSKSTLLPGDVAIVRTGYPGTAAVIPSSLGVANCSDLVLVRPGPEIAADFLAAFFNSSFGKGLVSGKLVGAAQKHFNVGAAKAVVLHLPPLTEQRKIMAAVMALRAEIDHLESLLEFKLTALDEIKQSLLHQAFTGTLTSKSTDLL